MSSESKQRPARLGTNGGQFLVRPSTLPLLVGLMLRMAAGHEIHITQRYLSGTKLWAPAESWEILPGVINITCHRKMMLIDGNDRGGVTKCFQEIFLKRGEIVAYRIRRGHSVVLYYGNREVTLLFLRPFSPGSA